MWHCGVVRTQDLAARIIELAKNNPRVAIMMSGQGSNALRILENRNLYPSLSIVVIVSDSLNSNARQLGKIFKIPSVIHYGKNREDLFREIGITLDEFNIDFLLYAGFMKISPEWFVNRFPGINMHPTDLTILNGNGIPKYTGMKALSNAIADKLTSISSTLHVVDVKADHGTPIAISKGIPLKGEGNEDPIIVHSSVKTECEHVMYPYILSLLAQGAITRDKLPIRL